MKRYAIKITRSKGLIVGLDFSMSSLGDCALTYLFRIHELWISERYCIVPGQKWKQNWTFDYWSEKSGSPNKPLQFLIKTHTSLVRDIRNEKGIRLSPDESAKGTYNEWGDHIGISLIPKFINVLASITLGRFAPIRESNAHKQKVGFSPRSELHRPDFQPSSATWNGPHTHTPSHNNDDFPQFKKHLPFRRPKSAFPCSSSEKAPQ